MALTFVDSLPRDRTRGPAVVESNSPKRARYGLVRTGGGRTNLPFQVEVMGFESHPGYWVVIGLYAVRFASRPLLCGDGRISHGCFSLRAVRDAVNGDRARRRSSNGRALLYHSTIRPVAHPLGQAIGV